ncbi:prion-inhibition and propagation-domain-containing protein [Cercophora newfieldiana]|uniref:Prion-inhibition and propagation-domain-containing protein n=1 Tax=Cercophora newfieldiana TaxID=92897 RepID=A0AA40CU00_9PEZI|nr:prion-inhibition and propagation-domain-containing protein [Cercophora newfieldiana]
MEAVGLAIGTIGLIGAFKDAIDLFALFTASRSFGRDFVILLTKFDIEKYLLLQWAEQVKLLDHTAGEFYDVRLNREDIQVSVAQILSCIRLLLSDTAELKRRYGVESAPSPSDAKNLIDVQTEAVGMSGPCMKRFEQRFEELSISIGERQRSATPWAKARWAIQDKRKFADLVSELAHFTTKLREIVPPTATSQALFAQLVNTGDLEKITDLDRLKIVLEAAAGHRGAIAGPAQELIDQKCQKRILAVLWHRSIDERRRSVSDAHKKTFQWALKLPDDAAVDLRERNENLARWLCSGSGIYWVSGKAGSGKSTFMKFLYSCPQTKELLDQWASPEECIVADFFFYYLGAPEQNTKAGLCRALLFKILSNCPSLVSKALPNLWREVNEGQKTIALPSSSEISYAFEFISSHHHLPRMCIFIDGLDEYIGEFRPAIALINQLTMNPKLKILISSRPEPLCVAALEGLPKLKLQDLTEGDIALYVHDVIGENRYMKRLLKSDPVRSARVMKEIVYKASGVFLWVVLACRNLLDGFDNYDRIQELQARVHELPEELKEMFIHMLRKVDKRHASQASRLLRICLLHKKAQDQKSTELGRLYALELAFIADRLDLGPGLATLCFLGEYDRFEVVEQLAGRLRSRCGGLLELADRGSARDEPEGLDEEQRRQESFCFCSKAEWDDHEGAAMAEMAMEGYVSHDAWTDSTVVFMHRSVFHFLDTDEAWEAEPLKSAVIEVDFAAIMSLSRLYLALQSQRVRCPDELHQMLACLRDGIFSGVDADQDRPDNEDNIFWEMGPCLDALESTDNPVFGFWSGMFQDLAIVQSHGHGAFIIAIEAGASSYVKKQLDGRFIAEDVNRPACGCRPFLQYAVDPSGSLLGILPVDYTDPRATPWQSISNFGNMLDVLFSAGCDPNGIMDVPSTGDDEFEMQCNSQHHQTGHVPISPDTVLDSHSHSRDKGVTVWEFWLQRCAQLLSCPPDEATIETKASILDGIEAFIRAGADLGSTEMQVESVVRAIWTEPRLKDRAEQVMQLCKTTERAAP